MKKFYFLSTALLFSFINCFSQAGTLDASFGTGGKVITNILDINKGSEAFNAVAVQPDGKIIVAGTTMTPGIIFRYNADGSPDNSFDGDGMFFSFGYKFFAVALQPDGKILTAGNGFVMRLHPNGSLDNSFDGDGIASGVATSFIVSIVLQNDGKIIVASATTVARFNTNGSPDNSFDGDGQATIYFSAGSNEIRGAAIQTDGKIVLSGYVYNGTTNLFGVARCNADGSMDNSFDGDGMLTTSFGTLDDYGCSVVVQNDGKIVVAGYTNHDLALVRYNSNGSLDISFDGDGTLVTVTGSPNNPPSMVLQNDGKILVTLCSSSDFAVFRYNTNGSPDNSFDGDGKALIDLGATVDRPTCMALQSNGKIVVGGFREMTSARDFALVRYNTDGSPDNSFDSDGILTGYFGTSYDIGRSMAIQNDGKIVVAGYTGTVDLGTNNDFALARYNPNGTLDNSFDGDGKVVTAIGTNNDNAYAVAIQTDGKIVVAGRSLVGSFYDVSLARYNTDGSPDNGFDGDGKVIFSASAGHDIVTSIAIQSDGKILVAGSALIARLNSNGTLDNSFDGDGIVVTPVGGSVSIMLQNDGKIIIGGSNASDFALARYNTDGSSDNSFDGDGLVTTDINISTDGISSIALQSDGKIVAAGMSETNFAVARYNANGSLDNSFDGDGKLTTDMGGVLVKAASVAIQSNGKIIVAGENRKSNSGDGDFILARYNTDGSPDNSFDSDGKAVLDVWQGSFEHLWDMKLYSDRIYLAGEMLTAGAVDFVVAAVTNDAVNSSLPLHFLDFSGKLVNADALLNWKTENEVNTLEFIVEKSAEGRHYTPAGSVASANSAGIHNYNFTDPNVTSLNTSILYYRLKQKDIDGRFTYSRIVALPLDKSRNIVLFYPNPVINEANLTITVNRPERVNAKIIDSKGRLVKQQYWSISAGSTSLSIDVQGLAKGMYYLELKGETIRYNKQFVK